MPLPWLARRLSPTTLAQAKNLRRAGAECGRFPRTHAGVRLVEVLSPAADTCSCAQIAQGDVSPLAICLRGRPRRRRVCGAVASLSAASLRAMYPRCGADALSLGRCRPVRVFGSRASASDVWRAMRVRATSPNLPCDTQRAGRACSRRGHSRSGAASLAYSLQVLEAWRPRRRSL